MEVVPVYMLTFSTVFLIFMIDILVTIYKLVDFATTMEKIKVQFENLKLHYAKEDWFKNGSIIEMLESLRIKAEADRHNFNQSVLDHIEHLLDNQKHIERFIRKFPTLKSTKYREEIIILREKMKRRFSKK